LEVGAWKSRILHAPEDERRPVADTAEPRFDLRMIGRRGCDLSWIEGSDATPLERAKRPQVHVRHIRRQLADDALLERQRREPIEIHLDECTDGPAGDLRKRPTR